MAPKIDEEKPPGVRAMPCPSCGMVTMEGPHATSAQCIRALEAEMIRLSELLARVRRVPEA